MKQNDKLSIQLTIIIVSCILGSFYYFTQTNKQKPTEKQFQITIEEDQPKIKEEKKSLENIIPPVTTTKNIEQQKNLDDFTNKVLIIYKNLYYGNKLLSESADYVSVGDYRTASEYNLKANDYFILETEKSRDLLKYNTPKGYEKVSENAFCASSGLMFASANYTTVMLGIVKEDFDLAESANLEASNHLDISSKCMHLLARWLEEQGK